MKAPALLAVAALLLSGRLASADDHGGKVAWLREPEFALAKAKLEGRALMLFFTADWWGYCRQLGAAALSDDKVAAAAQRLVPVYVDCTKKGDYAALLARYKVKGYPTVIYADADGNPLREMNSRDAADLIKDIDAAVGKVVPQPTIWQPSAAAAREIAKKSKKPVAIYYVDPKADLQKFNAKLMKDLGERKTKFFWVLEAGTEALRKYELSAAPAVVVIDPKTDEAVAKIPLKDDDKADVLNKALDDAAKQLKK